MLDWSGTVRFDMTTMWQCPAKLMLAEGVLRMGEGEPLGAWDQDLWLAYTSVTHPKWAAREDAPCFHHASLLPFVIRRMPIPPPP